MAFGPGADSTEPVHTGLRGVIAAPQGHREAADGGRAAGADGRGSGVRHGSGHATAQIAAALCDVETALELFEGAAARGVVRVPFGHDIHSDPLFDPLRGSEVRAGEPRGKREGGTTGVISPSGSGFHSMMRPEGLEPPAF